GARRPGPQPSLPRLPLHLPGARRPEPQPSLLLLHPASRRSAPMRARPSPRSPARSRRASRTSLSFSSSRPSRDLPPEPLRTDRPGQRRARRQQLPPRRLRLAPHRRLRLIDRSLRRGARLVGPLALMCSCLEPHLAPFFIRPITRPRQLLLV